MKKILIFKGDELETHINLPSGRFVFILCEDKEYHIDFSNGIMHRISEEMHELGKAHREIISQNR